MLDRQMAVDLAIAELVKAQDKYPAFHSNHEGYAVIREEVDELWDEVKKSKPFESNERLRKEAVQVAAMALRFLIDRC